MAQTKTKTKAPQQKKKTVTKAEVKAKAKAQTKAKKWTDPWTVAERLLASRLLMTVNEEIADLAEVLEALPTVSTMVDAIHDVQCSPSSPKEFKQWDRHGVNDRIGKAAFKHYGQSLNNRLSQPGMHLAENTYNRARDLDYGIYYVVKAIRWRLYRLEAFIKLMQERRPRE